VLIRLGYEIIFEVSGPVPMLFMARGRDAVDVALTTSFGPTQLKQFTVWTDEVDGAQADLPKEVPSSAQQVAASVDNGEGTSHQTKVLSGLREGRRLRDNSRTEAIVTNRHRREGQGVLTAHPLGNGARYSPWLGCFFPGLRPANREAPLGPPPCSGKGRCQGTDGLVR
jgi:hypothetical protein